jgi:hypothetical protein
MYPDMGVVHSYLGIAYLQKSMYEEALVEFSEKNIWRQIVYARMGETERVRKWIDENKKRLHSHKHPLLVAQLYAEFGEDDQVFYWLEKAYEDRDAFLIVLRSIPILDNYQENPRFKALLRKWGWENN